MSWAAERKPLIAEAKKRARARGHKLQKWAHWRDFTSGTSCTVCLCTVYVDYRGEVYGDALDRDCD
jgi:hypothetical protein